MSENEPASCACGDPVWEYTEKCSACHYDDEIDRQTEAILERMHGIDN